MIRLHDELAGFFDWCHSRLCEVLDAGGAREIWLQAEAYRYFRHHRAGGRLIVRTNAHNKSDLAFYGAETSEAPDAIVELKLFGLNYLPKNLTGHHDMTPYTPTAGGVDRFVFDPSHVESCHPTEGSILKDYKKLLGTPGLDRFLLLVLDTRAEPTAFGRAIQCVDFGGPANVLHDVAPVKVACWEIR